MLKDRNLDQKNGGGALFLKMQKEEAGLKAFYKDYILDFSGIVNEKQLPLPG
jgi:hypothetical protein